MRFFRLILAQSFGKPSRDWDGSPIALDGSRLSLASERATAQRDGDHHIS